MKRLPFGLFFCQPWNMIEIATRIWRVCCYGDGIVNTSASGLSER